MLISLSTTLIVSYVAKILFERRILSPQYDFLHCLVDIPNEILPLKESTTTDELHNQYRSVQQNASSAMGHTLLAEPTTMMMINNSYSPSQDTLSTYASTSGR